MFSVVIPMAGSGIRTGLNVNKALYKLNGKPIFMFSYETFKKFDCEIILVCREEDVREVKKYAKDAEIVIGASTRAKSVYNGVMAASNDLVLIHDAARPFITEEIINNVLEKMNDSKALYVGIKAVDTVRDLDNNVLDRNSLIMVQTPQALYKNDYVEAFNALKDKTLTDDVEYVSKHFGYKIDVVEGTSLNFKITTYDDILLAQALWEEENV